MVLEMLVAHVAKNASRLGARVEALVAAPHAAQLALVKKRHREQAAPVYGVPVLSRSRRMCLFFC